MYLSHRSRFLRLVERFLQTDYISQQYLESLLLKISKISLFSPSAATLVLLGLQHQVMKRNPSLQSLIHVDPTKLSQPEQAEIQGKQLYNLVTLRDHVLPLICKTANVFKEPFHKDIDLEEFLDLTYADLFDYHIKRKETALNPVFASGFTEDDVFV